ncbi:hypothetical protein J6590_091594 [Homalodisca vitripennis]|nr:hypothetical protein J6590_091594 [Homalodisca vitripennis]
MVSKAVATSTGYHSRKPHQKKLKTQLTIDEAGKMSSVDTGASCAHACDVRLSAVRLEVVRCRSSEPLPDCAVEGFKGQTLFVTKLSMGGVVNSWRLWAEVFQ